MDEYRHEQGARSVFGTSAHLFGLPTANNSRTKCSMYRRRKSIAKANSASGTTKSPLRQDCALPPLTQATTNSFRYLFSVLLQRTAAAIRLPWLFLCDAGSLRVTNVLGLLVLVCLALRCRHELESRHETRPAKQVSAYAIHSAINIGLFPLIFFFSGLYYTDVISTAVVVGTYLNHLKRVHIANRSLLNDLLTIILGIATLIMRQTNIFWVVVYLGGLEAVHAIKTLRPPRAEQPTMASVWEHAKFCVWRYSVGDVHDLPLDRAWPDGKSRPFV